MGPLALFVFGVFTTRTIKNYNKNNIKVKRVQTLGGNCETNVEKNLHKIQHCVIFWKTVFNFSKRLKVNYIHFVSLYVINYF